MTEGERLFNDIMAERMPANYLETLGLRPYEWQQEALDPTVKRLLLLCARQSGKSTVIGGKALQNAKYHPGALILLISPAQDQSKELMKKIEAFMYQDKSLPKLKHDAVYEKEFVNGSRIVALPGSERSVRGYSGPKMILIDEASRVEIDTYRAVRPMMTGEETDTELILMSTPFGKRGFFYEAWHSESDTWRKILVKAPAMIEDGMIKSPTDEDKYRGFYQAKGVSAYYSPRHTIEFLQEEYENIGDHWFRQEYLVEFIEPEGTLFSAEDIERARTGIKSLRFESRVKEGVKSLRF